jgi:deoxyribodipyrimidine photo-lyase
VAGDPVQVLPRLASLLEAPAVVWSRDVEPYARERDRQVAKALQADGRKVLVDWDQLLLAPDLIKTGGGDPYRVFGPFPAQLARSRWSAVRQARWRLPRL